MTSQNRNIEEPVLKNRWKELGKDSEPLSKAELYRILHRNNLVMRLRRRAILIFLLGCLGPFLINFMASFQPLSVMLRILYSVFMLFCAGLSLYWWYRLGRIYDFMTIPVIQAKKKMDELNRLRVRCKIIGWVTGAPVIGLLFYEILMEGPEDSFYGALIGAFIGLAIGLTWEYLNRRQVKDIRNTFTDESEEE